MVYLHILKKIWRKPIIEIKIWRKPIIEIKILKLQ
nr:MAG TPA: hypothetical protein [Caudoviricetes sp.]